LKIQSSIGKYALNYKSEIVKMLYGVQHKLSMEEFEKQAKIDNETIGKYTDEEIDKMFETDVPDISLDELERKLSI